MPRNCFRMTSGHSNRLHSCHSGNRKTRSEFSTPPGIRTRNLRINNQCSTKSQRLLKLTQIRPSLPGNRNTQSEFSARPGFDSSGSVIGSTGLPNRTCPPRYLPDTVSTKDRTLSSVNELDYS
uniref:Uncharacterized protein n=1 Tax=Cacopsylla melanoneura TaxID=428564 RepID=A0A8D8LNZ0_9HEMI